MRIRGTTRPMCSLCAFAEDKDGRITCKITNESKTAKDQCPKFRYDIFKYKPNQKVDFGNFSGKDFEI